MGHEGGDLQLFKNPSQLRGIIGNRGDLFRRSSRVRPSRINIRVVRHVRKWIDENSIAIPAHDQAIVFASSFGSVCCGRAAFETNSTPPPVVVKAEGAEKFV